RDFFGIKGMDLKDLPLIDRINIHFKAGTCGDSGVTFNAEEQAFVDRIAAAESFDDVTVIAQELYTYCGNTKADKDKQMQAASGSSNINNQSEESGESSGRGRSGNNNDPAAAAEAGEGVEGEKQIKNNGKPENAGGEKSSANYANTPAKSITQNKMRESLESHRTKATSSTTTVMETPILENIVVDYKQVLSDFAAVDTENPTEVSRWKSEITEFIKESGPAINHMVKQFEMRKAADAAKRTSISRSGVLDTVRMVNYKINDDIFRRNAVVQDGKNHGLVMYIDWSSSMTGVLRNTVKQLLQLVLFCKKVNIPFEVYAFSSVAELNKNIDKTNVTDWGMIHPSQQWKSNAKNGIMTSQMSSFALINFLSSRMKMSEFKEGINCLWIIANDQGYYGCAPKSYCLGSTPLDEAIICAMDMVPQFQARNKVQIVNTIFLTDGEASGHGISAGDNTHTKCFIVDPKTNKTYDNNTQNKNQYVGNLTTNNLIRILRDRTKANAIGFFLMALGKSTHAIESMFTTYDEQWRRIVNQDGLNVAIESWKNNGFFCRPDSGYTEEYCVSVNQRIASDGENLGALKDGATVRAVQKALLRDAEAARKTRYLLSRFIDLIAK
ncbi:MAG: hypothetical protein ACO4AM_06245, partial [Candidatus Nanopelagicaceae bacterium]